MMQNRYSHASPRQSLTNQGFIWMFGDSRSRVVSAGAGPGRLSCLVPRGSPDVRREGQGQRGGARGGARHGPGSSAGGGGAAARHGTNQRRSAELGTGQVPLSCRSADAPRRTGLVH